MKKTTQSANERIDQLEKKLSELRKLKPNRPFPEEIWQEAIQLAKVAGVSTISNRLGLNYGRLKYRVATGKFELPAHIKGQKKEKKLDDSKIFLEVPVMPPMPPTQELRSQFKLQFQFGMKVFKLEWT